jgi:hypothetical protein
MLLEVGVISSIAPVFSNIPVKFHPGSRRSWLIDYLSLRCIENPYILGVFGEQLTAPTRSAVDELRTSILSVDPMRKICLAVCGRHTHKSLSFVNAMADLLQVHIAPIFLGYLDSESLSSFLASIDCGISTYPFELAGKSGAIAAFLDHGTAVALIGQNIYSGQASFHMLSPAQTSSMENIHSIAQQFIQHANKC